MTAGGSADVVVVGAGVIGLMTALELRRKGLSVTVFDAGAAGRESSWAGGGVLSPMPPWRYPNAVWDLCKRSLDLYPGLVAELIEHSGVDPEMESSGLLLLDEEAQPGLAWAQREGMAASMVEAGFASERGSAQSGRKGLLLPWVRQIRNPRLCRALVVRLSQVGVLLRERQPVRAIEIRDGRCMGVDLGGERVAAARVVLAAGAWSGLLARTAGIDIAIEPVRGQMLLLRSRPGRLREIVQAGKHYLIPRRDGRILAGSTVEAAGFDKQVTQTAREALLEFARGLLPELTEADVEAHWSGLRPGSGNERPLIQGMAGAEGLFVNTGHYRNGLAMAPASAERLTALVTA